MLSNHSYLCSICIVFSTVLFVDCDTIPSKSQPALFVVSFDGFRPDYLHKNITPNLNEFRRQGCSARFMHPVFPTKTFVNHHSIATGFYAGKHGILANSVYDSQKGLLGNSYELFHYNESIIPIYTANEMAGKHSGCMWPGSHFKFNNISCTFTNQYKRGQSFVEMVDLAMSWFTHDETPANLVMMYFDEPDKHSHWYGINSIEIEKQVAIIDNITRYIQDKLIEYRLENWVNVIHLSDHGMRSLTSKEFIDLTKFLANDTYATYGTSPVLQVVPNNPNLENEIFQNLTTAANLNGHFQVYNQYNLPTRWHISNPTRMGPILAVADAGYAFHDLFRSARIYEQRDNVTNTNDHEYGCHGYDNADPAMRAVFMAKGPLISEGRRLGPVNLIDLHNLFCLILKIECDPNDGSSNPQIWRKLFTRKARQERGISDI